MPVHQMHGNPMTVREVRALKVGDWVWFRYYEDEEERVDEPCQVLEVYSPGSVSLVPGDYSDTEYDGTDDSLDRVSLDENCGVGELFHVEEA